MRHAFTVGVVAAALMLGTAVAATAQITEDNVAEMVHKASTSAEHTALADYFRAQAKVASEQAGKHRAMLVGASPKSSRHVWDAHCKRLIRSFENEAAAYIDLAKEQDVLAKHAEQKH